MDNLKGLRSGCVIVSTFIMLFMCWLTTLLFVLPALAMLQRAA